MKKFFTTFALCLCFLCMTTAFVGCSSGNSNSTYELEATSGETFNVSVKTGDKYTVVNPTPAMCVVTDVDGNTVATVHMISRTAYDSYKSAATSLTSYAQIKNKGMEGFSYSSEIGQDVIYARCYAVTDKTAMYMETKESDDILNTVVGMLNIKSK